MIARAERMLGVHNDLVQVMFAAGQRVDFIITDGIRTRSKQEHLVSIGVSQTMDSRHLTGHAVDIAVLDKDGKVTWVFDEYKRVSLVVLECARNMGVDITWGGNWKSLRDGPHYELSRTTHV